MTRREVVGYFEKPAPIQTSILMMAQGARNPINGQAIAYRLSFC